ITAKLAHEIDGRARRATGCEQVVDDQHFLSLLDGVAVHFEAVAAVFEIVTCANRLCGQLPELPHRNEACANPIGDGRSQVEPAAFNSDDERHTGSAIRFRHAVDSELASLWVLTPHYYVYTVYTLCGTGRA